MLPRSGDEIVGERGREATRVLLVDDEPQTLDVYADVLGRWGYNVTKAQSSEMAIEALGRQHFDVVVVELRMPGGSGFKLLEAIRLLANSPPVIAMARVPSIGTVTRAFKAGAVDYLTKPFSIVELRAKIEEVLREKGRDMDERVILRTMNEKAEELAKVSSNLVKKAKHLLNDEGLHSDVRTILSLSAELAELGTRLSRVRIGGVLLRNASADLDETVGRES